MHPAPSIIFFTVLSGAGLGLMIWTGLGFGGSGPAFSWAASLTALGLTAAGGACSTLHLGRPANAIRAFSQWRSSWLSREACLMPAAMAVYFAYALIWILTDTRHWFLGWPAALLSLGTIWSTAMIYSQLKTVPHWSRTPTPALFVVLALVGGILALEGLQAATLGDAAGWPSVAALAIGAAVTLRWQTAARNAGRGSTGSSVETATGLGAIGKVRLFEAPHTGSNYLLREMAYQVGRKRAVQLRRLGAVLGFILPFILTILSFATGGWIILVACICHVVGVLALRWLFFAEAEHVQAFYYGYR